MQAVWTGWYLDGKTAARQRATARLGRSGLELTTEAGTVVRWPYAEIRQTQGAYAGEQVRLERGGDLAEALLVADAAFLTALRDAAAEGGSRFHDPARRRLRVGLTLGAAVALVGVLGALYLWGIPGLAAFLAPRVPVVWEERLGQAAVEHLAPPGKRCLDPARRRHLDHIVTTLTRPLGAHPYTFRVLVIDAAVVNAFAAPGGYVVVTRGLLEQARTPEELAGVLAHELQHVLLRHPTRALLQHASSGLILAALTGDASGVMAYGLESARTLGTLRYSRLHEEEADAEGLRMLVAAGIDPGSMARFLESLRTDADDGPAVLEYLSTHPSPRERVERLRALAARTPQRSAALLGEAEWRELGAICPAAPPAS